MGTHTKLDIATKQLRSAVMLFISGRDRISAITLAAAADAILSQLLMSAGKENLSDDLMRMDAEKTGEMPERGAHGRAVNDMLMVNALKHLDPGEDAYVEGDVLRNSLAAVAKAVANFVSLRGRDSDDVDFVEAFRLWARIFVPKGLDADGNPIQ